MLPIYYRQHVVIFLMSFINSFVNQNSSFAPPKNYNYKDDGGRYEIFKAN